MFSFTESGARSVRARRTAFCVLISTIIFVFSLTSTYGDCPLSPTTYENGVIEGFVGEGNVTGENTITSSIGMQAEGRFLIAWNGPVIVQSFPGYNRLLVHRFDADGIVVVFGLKFPSTCGRCLYTHQRFPPAHRQGSG